MDLSRKGLVHYMPHYMLDVKEKRTTIFFAEHLVQASANIQLFA